MCYTHLMEQLDIARDFFRSDRYAMVTTGIDILEVEPHHAKTVLKIHDGILNGLGNVMGGAIYTLADFTFAVSSNLLDDQGKLVEKTVTTNSSITYLSPVKGTELYGESHLIKNGRTCCTYEIRITDNLGTLVALVVTNGMKIG